MFVDGQLYFNNNSSSLFYKNCYLYDIRSCNIRILEKLNYKHLYDQLISKSKDKRVIRIGHLGRVYKKIIKNIDYIVSNIMKEFIDSNNISYDDIIFIQKDGILLKNYIDSKSKLEIQPELKHVFSYIIFQENKRTYLAKDEMNKCIITKNIQNKSIGLDNFLTEQLYNYDIDNFSRINEMIKNLFESNNPDLFAIPSKKKSDTLSFVKTNEYITISKDLYDDYEPTSLLKDLDRHYYFQNYIEKFISSLLITFLK